MQTVVGSLRYTYTAPGEEVPGVRQVIITASDGDFTASAVVMVRVVILNNNPPVISLEGQSTAVFVEGSTPPLPIGKCLECFVFQCTVK